MSKGIRKEINECTSANITFCNGVRKRILKEQSDYLLKHGRHMAVSLAVNSLLRRLIEIETK